MKDSCDLPRPRVDRPRAGGTRVGSEKMQVEVNKAVLSGNLRSYLRGFVWGITGAAVLSMITFPFHRRGVQTFWLDLFAGGEEFKQAAKQGFFHYLLVSELDAMKIILAVLFAFAVGDLIRFLKASFL